jgi:hypothetical protein
MADALVTHDSGGRIMSTFRNPLTEYSPEMEFDQDVGEYEGEGGVFSESEEMELTAELLNVTNEQELEQFFGDLISKAGSLVSRAAGAVKDFANSSVGQAIGGVLKSAAGAALPWAGRALGAVVGGPTGAQIGGGLASIAGDALGLELEGLSPEDREFEATRQFVRFAGETVKNALEAAPGADPAAVANAAAVEAARIHAPGLWNGTQPAKPRMGRWVRHEGVIVLHGV